MNHWRKKYKKSTKNNWKEDQLKYILWLERGLFAIKGLVTGGHRSVRVRRIIREALTQGE